MVARVTCITRTAQQQQADEDLATREHAGAISLDDALAELRQRYGVCATPGCGILVHDLCDGCGARICHACQLRHEWDGCPPPQVVDAAPFMALPDARKGGGHEVGASR